MDFFERQSKARRNTAVLILYFVLAVLLIVLAVYLAVYLVLFGLSVEHHHYGAGLARTQPLWNPSLMFWVALGTVAVIVVGMATKVAELSQGGSAVATMLGGRLVNPDTNDPDERKLLNVVEEMAIASGTPVPEVYLLPDESINAFAAGHTTSDAVIGVTRGCMRLLTRDELQGVIAHEFSHILNGDMRLNIRLIGLIFGIMGIATVGRILLRTRSSRGRNPLPLLGLLLLLIGSIGVFFGRLIQSAVSRQREHLADAAAVQFTRNPGGLAGALKKIGGLIYGSRVESPHASEVCHIFFANGLGASLLNMFATHPPLHERIRALDPYWDGKFIRIKPDELGAPEPAMPKAAPAKRPPIFVGAPGAILATPTPIRPEVLLPALGNPTQRHLKYATDWHESLPTTLVNALRNPFGASATVYALLLAPDEPVRRRQLEKLGGVVPPAVYEETLRLLPDVATAAARAKLPLVDLALPGLRGLSPSQFAQFKQAIKTLIEADEEIDLFEFVLQKVVIRHLEPHFVGARREPIQYYSLKPLLPDCAVLVCALAHIGHSKPDQVEAAVRTAWQRFRPPIHEPLCLPPADCSPDKLDMALTRLAQAAMQIKKNVLEACAHAVAADGVIKHEEAELLRAIADTLDCPVPPFVEGVQTAA